MPVVAAATAALALLPAAAGAATKAPTCDGKPATIVRGGGADTVSGTKGNDVIVTGAGDDVIRGKRGNDRVCAGPGDDRISGAEGGDSLDGGPGDDDVDGGVGTDDLLGGPGEDSIHGDRGNDRMKGGAGDDSILGALGDDTALGGTGTDRLFGGLGIDRLYGGPGNGDVISGDRGRDLVNGGPGGHDVGSWASATALPPRNYAQLRVEAYEPGTEDGIGPFAVYSPDQIGVSVNLITGTARDQKSFFKSEPVRGIEDLVGSAFADVLAGGEGPSVIEGGGGADFLYARPPTRVQTPLDLGIALPVPNPFFTVDARVLGPPKPGDVVRGGAGEDDCQGFESEESCGDEEVAPGDGEATTVSLASGAGGTNLTIAAGEASNEIRIEQRGETFVVTDPRGVAALDGCTADGGTVTCRVQGPLGSILVTGGAGDDLIEVADSVEPGPAVRIDGGKGGDTLLGGRTADVLEAGDSFGFDSLNGGPGNDGLSTGPGFDRVEGGSGSDLLIDASFCAGHSFSGGPGTDSVSFARTKGVKAQIGGLIREEGIAYGCPEPDRIDLTVENLEGSPGNDTLVGSEAGNKLLGRGGDDTVSGFGGDDGLVGGEGFDSLRGGAGFDRLFAKDGTSDFVLDCGADGGVAVIDGGDTPDRSCRR